MIKSPRCFCQKQSVRDASGKNVCAVGKCGYRFTPARLAPASTPGSASQRNPQASHWSHKIPPPTRPAGNPIPVTGQLEFAVNRSVSSPRGVGVGRPDGAQAEHELSEKEGPKCDCDGDISAVQRVSNTAKNPNRAFWVCSKGRDAVDKCGYFKWDDEIAVSGKRNDGFPMRFEDGGAAKRPRTGPRPGSGGSGSKVVSLALEEINAMSALVEPGTMSPDLEAALRELPGVTVVATPRARAFTAGNSSKYIIPFSVLDDSKRLCRTHGVSLESGVPPTVISRLQAFQQVEAHRKVTRKVITQGLDEILPAEMCEKLMEFQWEGIHFALSRGGRCLIGDDMGLGKTLQAIAVARIYRDDWPLLIICPSSLRLNWKEELLSWLGEDIDEQDINVMMKGTDCARRFSLVNIASYELVQKAPERELRKCRCIIADESHYVKSRETKRSQFVTPLVKRAPRALLLSGTPALSRPVELFPQVNALEPELFPNYQDFTERYCKARMGKWGWDVSGSSNLTELHLILRGSCLIRRQKEEVLTQLPAKQRGVVWVETTPKVMKRVKIAQAKYDEAKECLELAQSEDDAMRLQNAVRGAQNELYSLTGEAKVVSTQQYLKETLEATPGKILVFGHHSEVLMDLDDFVRKKLKTQTIVIDGKTPQHSRQGLCQKFQKDVNTRVAMLSITAAGVGLTLTAATVVVFAELYWTPGSLMQAEDRAHRIGQKDCVMVKYLLARDTLDESIWEAVKSKLKVVDQSLTGKSTNLAVSDQAEKASAAGGAMEKFLKRRGVVGEIEDIDESDGSPPGNVASIGGGQGPAAGLGDIHPSPGKVLPDGTIALDDDDDIFPTEVTIIDDAHSSRHREPKIFHYDADLALARQLQHEFDAEFAPST